MKKTLTPIMETAKKHVSGGQADSVVLPDQKNEHLGTAVNEALRQASRRPLPVTDVLDHVDLNHQMFSVLYLHDPNYRELVWGADTQLRQVHLIKARPPTPNEIYLTMRKAQLQYADLRY